MKNFCKLREGEELVGREKKKGEKRKKDKKNVLFIWNFWKMDEILKFWGRIVGVY